jgi:hypothetical protein
LQDISWKRVECMRIGQEEMGVSIDTPTLWLRLYNLTSSERDMDFFLATKEENGRMALL